MRYLSTRNPREAVSLSQAIAAGLAPDGGLYVPERLPRIAPDAWRPGSLPQTAQCLLAPFFEGDGLARAQVEIAAAALDFPAPLTAGRGEGSETLELFHGPTSAFKDFGARFLAECTLRIRPKDTRLTILVATSGDTGSAVAAAFHRQPGVDVVILYPQGLVSPRQEKQLTCWDENVHTLSVAGTFDDCQRLVKAAFQDAELRASHRFSSANSINIGRLLPQMVYYAAAGATVRERTGLPASFIVPSGNLGNALACLWARQVGAPIGDIVLAHNANRTVVDFLASGQWQPRPSVATLASAMDVGDPSNMERLRYGPRDAEAVRREVSAHSVSDTEIRSRIVADQRAFGRVWCPHSATAAQVHALLPEDRRKGRFWVIVATAHPAKFAEIVEPLIGSAVPLPDSLAALLERPRRCTEIEATLPALRDFLRRTCPPH